MPPLDGLLERLGLDGRLFDGLLERLGLDGRLFLDGLLERLDLDGRLFLDGLLFLEDLLLASASFRQNRDGAAYMATPRAATRARKSRLRRPSSALLSCSLIICNSSKLSGSQHGNTFYARDEPGTQCVRHWSAQFCIPKLQADDNCVENGQIRQSDRSETVHGTVRKPVPAACSRCASQS